MSFNITLDFRLYQSHSLLISGSGSWPQREGRALALSLAFAAENQLGSGKHKNLPLALRAREKIWARLVGKSRVMIDC